MPHSASPAAASGPDDDPVRGSAVAEGTGPRVGAVVGAELPGAGTVEGGVGVGQRRDDATNPQRAFSDVFGHRTSPAV